MRGWAEVLGALISAVGSTFAIAGALGARTEIYAGPRHPQPAGATLQRVPALEDSEAASFGWAEVIKKLDPRERHKSPK